MKKLSLDFLHTLELQPQKGAAAGLGAWMLAQIEAINPFLQFAALGLGVGVAALTMVLKAIQIYKELKNGIS